MIRATAIGLLCLSTLGAFPRTVPALSTDSQQPIHIEMDSELQYRVRQEGAEPLVYVPLVDVKKLDEPSIIDGF